MNVALIFSAVYFVAMACLSIFFNQPFVFIVSLLLFPNLLSALPWGLAVSSGEGADASGPMGFVNTDDED